MPSYQYPPASPVSRPGQTASPPRLRNSAVRKPGGSEGPYAKAQRSGESTHPDDGTWNRHPAPTRTASGSDRPQPPLVAESSFDSEHFSNSHYTHPSHPPTPGSGVPFHDPAHSFYGPGSFGSFDTVMPHPPPYGDFRRHHHRPPVGPYPESPYSPYSQHSGYHSHHSYYSPGGYYPHDYGYPGYGPPPSYEDDERGMLKDYHPDRDGEETKAAAKNSKNISKAAAGIVLPAAASEVDFDVHDPPMDFVCPPSTEPLVESMAEVNTYDVLCGRGGGTNSQIGNKRFRKLVQEFQPTYLLARRKEKPLLARSIVLIIRKRGGRFLRKDEETGMLYEVGDTKAEAKTSQALREGLDVRATKSNGLKKKKKGGAAAAGDTDQSQEDKTEAPETEISADQAKSGGEEKTPERPTVAEEKSPSPVKKEPESPPVLPKLAPEVKAGMVHPHSPEDLQFRKRRRMRPLACGADKFFPDFCPPRADLARTASPTEGKSGNSSVKDATAAQPYRSPVRMSSSIDEDDTPKPAAPGCTAAAFEIMTGAVTGGLCFGPSSKK